MKCGGVNSITCTVPGESCIEGICRCGTSGSCENRRSGYYCDPIRSECLCSASLKSCSDTERGTMCDQKDNSCKCSATTSACSGIHFCDNGSCIGSLIVLKLYVTMKYNWYVIFFDKISYINSTFVHLFISKRSLQPPYCLQSTEERIVSGKQTCLRISLTTQFIH